MKNNMTMKPLALAIAAAVIGSTAYAYTQGEGEIATVNKGDVVEKSNTLTAPKDKNGNVKLKDSVGSHLSELNRAGNPVRIIWYGNENDPDGKVAQKGALNNGTVLGSVTAQGVRTYNKDQKAGEVSIEGQANAIDALGWSAPGNVNDVAIQLTDVTNNGTAAGQASLKGGQAAVHSKVKSFVSANGMSFVATADFGKDVAVDGISGASGGGGSASLNNTASSELGDDDLDDMFADDGKGENADIDVPANTDEVDMHGKSAQVDVKNITNNGLIKGYLNEQGIRVPKPPKDTYTPMFYGATATASGNGVNLTSYVDTPDKYTFSDEKFSTATLRNINNYGEIEGSADIKGGSNVTHTYTKTIAAANGLSAYASTGRFGQQSTAAGIGLRMGEEKTPEYEEQGGINNQGRISGSLNQISGNNSGFNSPHVYSTADSTASGNGISVYTETQRSAGPSTQVGAIIGPVYNTGRISGDAYLKAGSGSGDLTVNALAVGNGISLYQNSNSMTSVSLQSVENKGLISGRIETHAGIVASSAKKGMKIPTDKEARFYVYTKDSFEGKADTKPGLPEEALTRDASTYDKTQVGTDSYGSFPNFHAESTITASGNGIMAFSGLGSADLNDGAKIGDISNEGVISGYNKLYHGYSRGYASVTALATGVGIAVDSYLIRGEDKAVKVRKQWNEPEKIYNIPKNEFSNSGIISGNYAALLAKANLSDRYSRNPDYTDKSNSGYQGSGVNYGLMAGTMIAGNYRAGIPISASTEQTYTYYEIDNVLDNKGVFVYLKPSITFVKEEYTSPYLSGVRTRLAPKYNEDYEFIDRIVVGEGGKHTINDVEYNVINADLTEDKKDSQKVFNGKLDYSIINGVGLNKGAAIAEGDLEINHSIINGYRTALYVSDDANVKVSDTKLNANGFKVNRTLDTYAVLGSAGNNTLTLSDGAIVNGDINLGDGDDTLNIVDNSVNLNGNTIDMGAGNNTVNFGIRQSGAMRAAGDDTFRLSSTLKNASNLVFNSDTVLTPTSILTGVEHITLNGNLTYQALGETGHALYQDANDENASSNIVMEGKGALLVDTREDNIKKLSFGKAKLALSNDITLKSATESASNIRTENGNIVIVTLQDKENAEKAAAEAAQKAAEALAEKKRAEEAENAKAEAIRKELAEKQDLLDRLNKAEANSAQNQTALDALKQQIAQLQQALAQANKTADNASDERKEADQAYWLADLASRNAAFLAGTDAGDPKDGFLKNSYSLLNKNENLTSTDGYNAATAKAQLAVQDYLDKTQNHNIYGALSGFALDSVRTYRNESLNQATHLSAGEVKTNASVIAHKNNYRDMADSSTSTGVLMNTEVGLTDNLTLGVSAGAAKEKLNGKQSAYVKGDSIYSGAYLNTGVGNFNLITGAAYEKINLKGQRTINNGYDAQQFDVKLAPTILTAYTQARYAIPFGDTFSIVPKIGMAYNSVKIDAINESGSGALRVEQKRQNTIEALVGQDFVANIQTGSGKFSTKVSLDYVHTSGQKDLSASFQNGNSFNLNTEKNPNSFNIGTYAEYQWNNGVSVKAGLNNAFRSSGSAVSGLVGMGYKF